MRPERFRRRLGFALCGAAPLTLLSADPALSQGPTVNFVGNVPLAVALGTGAVAVLPPGRRTENILDFTGWLGEADAATLAARLADLRSGGQSFDLMFTARDARQVRAIGWSLGAGVAMRVRPTLYQPGQKLPSRSDDLASVLSMIPDPAVLLGEGRTVVLANAAYQALSRGRTGSIAEIAG